MRNIGLATALSVAMLSGAAVAQQADTTILAGTCAGCHGPGGKGSGAIPPLAGHSKDYLVAAMKALKSGERQATVMNRLAKGYTEAEIVALADHFSALKR